MGSGLGVSVEETKNKTLQCPPTHTPVIRLTTYWILQVFITNTVMVSGPERFSMFSVYLTPKGRTTLVLVLPTDTHWSS